MSERDIPGQPEPTSPSHSSREKISSSEYFGRLYDFVGVPIFVKDKNLRFVHVNKAFCDFIGKTKEELLGSLSSSFATDEEQRAYDEGDQHALFSNDRITSSQQFFHPDEGIRKLNIVKIGHTSDDGERFVVGTIQDITEKENAQSELLNLVLKTRDIINSVHEGIIVYGTDLRYKEWNPFMERLTGKRADEVIGRYPSEVFPFLSEQGIIKRLEEILSGGPEFIKEFPFRMEKEGIAGVASDRSQPLYDNKGKIIGILSMVSDVTSQKTKEGMLKIRSELYKYVAEHTLEELLQKTLDEVCKLTDSKIGFYHFVEEDQKTISLQAWSTGTQREFCKAEGKGMHYSIDKAGVWVDCVRQKHAVIHNDYPNLPNKKGLPEGHAHLQRELVVPIMKNGLVVAILGVGNKPVDYTEQDKEMVTFIADVAWRIAEQKKAKDELNSQKRFFEQMFMQSSVSTQILNRDGWCERINPKLSQIFGVDPVDIEGKKYNIFSDESIIQNGIIPHLEKAFQEGKIAEWEVFFDIGVAADSQNIPVREKKKTWYNNWAYPIFDEEGKISHVIIQHNDITDRKKSEERLRKNKEQLVDAQKMAKIGSIANDFGVADKSWTDEIYSIFEIDNSKEITTEILIAQIHPEDRSYVSAICSNFHKQQSEGYDVNYRLLFPDGRIKYIHEQCKIVFDEHNKPIRSLSTIQDVTKEKIMEQDLLKNVKTDIISSVAHDVNNSLSAILAYSDVITTQLEHQQYDKAKASAEKMNLAGMAARTRVKKIQEVITATKVKEIGYIEFSLDTILRSFVDKDESKGIEIKVELESDELHARGNASELYSAFDNLIKNAKESIKETAGKGEIILKAVKKGDKIFIKLTDTGKGMSQEIQSKIWEVGFSTKSQENGKPRGLGMGNVKSILKEHGGNIRIVSSEIGYGTTFEITLPGIKTPEVINDATETSNVAKRKARILLVDDEETILDSGSQSLLHRGHSVDSAQGGKGALELLEKEEYDIIITDFNMPDMNGIELVQKIQERGITTPIIITTGNVRFSSPFLDNVFVLYKPCEPSDIEARIQIVMDEKDKQGEL